MCQSFEQKLNVRPDLDPKSLILMVFLKEVCIKKLILGAQKNSLIETGLLSTHNICFN